MDEEDEGKLTSCNNSDDFSLEFLSAELLVENAFRKSFFGDKDEETKKEEEDATGDGGGGGVGEDDVDDNSGREEVVVWDRWYFLRKDSQIFCIEKVLS